MTAIHSFFFFLFSFFFLLSSCSKPRIYEGTIQDVILTEKDSYFYIDAQSYPQNDKTLPVGIFDSGTGGLTVFDAIVRFDQFNNDDFTRTAQGDGVADFRSEYFIYLGDQANMPYGNYSLENNLPLLKEHIIKDVQFLLGRRYYAAADAEHYATDKQPVKAIVIACNTATAYGKTDIEAFLERAGLDIKIIGVVDAGARGALEFMKPVEDGSIAVMATAGTVASGGYVTALRTQLEQHSYTGDIVLFQQAGIGLAGAIDGSTDYISPDAVSPREAYRGPSVTFSEAPLDHSILERYGFVWDNHQMLFDGERSDPENVQINSVENYIAYHVTSLMEQVRKSGDSKPLKAIILGCTHYPFYTNVFKMHLNRLYNLKENGRYVYRPFMSADIPLIDPALNTARELYVHLREASLFNRSEISRSEFFISIPNRFNTNVRLDSAGNFTYAYKYGRQAGYIQEYVRRVPFSRETLPLTTIERLQSGIPSVFELIHVFNAQNPKMRSMKKEDQL